MGPGFESLRVYKALRERFQVIGTSCFFLSSYLFYCYIRCPYIRCPHIFFAPYLCYIEYGVFICHPPPITVNILMALHLVADTADTDAEC